MSRVFIAGIGAVSPAGWNVAALRAALERGEPLAVQSLARPGADRPLPARLVPNPPTRPDFLAHPRLRRSSPVTHYAASAALEAVAGLRAKPEAKELRFGIVACLQSGCVQYSCRFYDETLKNPATASPLVFPETVYAAPTSHVAALLGNVELACSLVGDSPAFLQGVALGAEWLAEDRVDACVVIGADENNWVVAEAARLLEPAATVAAGAGALCLCRDQAFSAGVELDAITDAHSYASAPAKLQAVQSMRRQLEESSATALLVDGAGNSPGSDAAERAAWSDWAGTRLSPKRVLGEGMMAGAAWQCVAACDAVATGKFAVVSVSLAGSNQQAIGARFVRG
jgi:hypothetical protein